MKTTELAKLENRIHELEIAIYELQQIIFDFFVNEEPTTKKGTKK